ncbi:MAG: hypothetical protein KGJ61_09150 [Candidatus Omnitrophica bacterium]|nr:hypothetical protein [Candidatus Omnitrophota bacterium]
MLVNGTLVAGCILLIGITGCTTTYRKSTTTQTQTCPAGSEASTASQSSAQTANSQSTVKTKNTMEVKTKPHGLIAGFFYFLGDVIAFPFRLIGGLFDAIF